MNRRTILTASIMVSAMLVFRGVNASPPEGKGLDQNAGRSGKSSNGNPNSGRSNNGGPDRGKSGKEPSRNSAGNKHQGHGSNQAEQRGVAGRSGYDSQGRNYHYFDDHREVNGRHLGGDDLSGLMYAGITAALAHRYAVEHGFTGYSSLPPGIRKNLARGKPLPPGIQKKMVPGLLLDRLPRYPGYEWRVAGSDLILIAVATAVVADILYDVFR